MRINLTKLLSLKPDYRPIGTTGDYGHESLDKTSQEKAYAFKLRDFGEEGKG